MTPAEIQDLAQGAVLPAGVTDIVMVTRHARGDTFRDGTPRGNGGPTLFGPAWVLRGRELSEPIALMESQRDARSLHQLLVGPEGELWQRKERRLAAIAAEKALEEAEAEAGDGSSRPERSSSRRSATTRRPTSRRPTRRAA